MARKSVIGSTIRLLACIAVSAAASASCADAADTIRLGKSVPFAWAFTPVEIGIEEGIWAKNGLDLQVTSFGGDAKLQQAMAAGALDLALGSGPGLGFLPKGVPAKGVAAFASAPYSLGIVVRYDSPMRTVADLKGKRFAVTTVGSLTDWMLKRVAIAEGWKPTDVTAVALGTVEAFIAALKTSQVDGLVIGLETGFTLEETKQGRNLLELSGYAPDFITHVIYAHQEMIDKQPDVVQRFVNAWFQTIAFVKASKARSVEVAARVLQRSNDVISRTYDIEIKMMLDDGLFDPKAIAVLKQSFIDMGILNRTPSDDELFTTRFVPANR
jgi:ABC-type nitrate/sulfonate/bicarbonate transport system substrate-binding protein